MINFADMFKRMISNFEIIVSKFETMVSNFEFIISNFEIKFIDMFRDFVG